MTFISNNLAWAASIIVDLYKHRWAIEAFCKQLKQTLQLGSFLGHNKNAIQWQVWMALLLYMLLRFLAHISTWQHSFSRLAGLIRSSLWSCIDICATLESCGTAGSDTSDCSVHANKHICPDLDDLGAAYAVCYGTACG